MSVDIATMDAVIATWSYPNMYRARRQARRYAELFWHHERHPDVQPRGAWRAWWGFVSQWPEGSPQRVALQGVFELRLDELDEAGLYTDLPDIW